MQTLKNDRKTLLLKFGGFIFLLVITIVAVSIVLQRRTPEYKENQFVKAVANENWSALYDFAHKSTWSDTGVSRQEFVELMNFVCAPLPDGSFKRYRIEPFEFEQSSDLGDRHTAKVIFLDLKTYRGSNMEFYFQTAKSREGWVIPVAELPVWIAECVTNNRDERHRYLLQAMTHADIEEYPVNGAGLIMVRSGLERYLSGKADSDAVAFVKR